ncbi:hypothetical protein GF336_00305 [Candidatus Woesearchaeota archaeon]|nr:hypothetical protein [Candidatus Woesearchaeota archaeon]
MNEITFEKFEEKFKPIKNKVEGAPIDGYMFETYGEEIKRVKEQDKNKIWTVIDGEGSKLYLINGYHPMNRLGYIITEKAWTEDIEIEV